jgi:hypothetical protein
LTRTLSAGQMNDDFAHTWDQCHQLHDLSL